MHEVTRLLLCVSNKKDKIDETQLAWNCTYSNSTFAYELQDPKVLGAATCSTDTACGKGNLLVLRMIVASSVLPEMPGASPVNVKRVNLELQHENLNMSETNS